MSIVLRHNIILILLTAMISLVVFFSFSGIARAQGFIATTTVTISVCGDGIAAGVEICDDGFANNDGAYSSSIAGRRCKPDCSGYGPYCGDVILQSLNSEECDDGNNSAGDLCSPICQNEEDPINTTEPVSGGGTGGGAGGVVTGVIPVLNPTSVNIYGKGYPRSTIHILKDGEALAKVLANGSADFEYKISDLTPGPATFAFWAEDGGGNRSITFTTTFQVTQNAVTTVKGIFLPPTIAAKKTSVQKGGTMNFSGQTIPNAKVLLNIDAEDELTQETESDGVGLWDIVFDTTPLENEMLHTAKAAFTYTNGDEELQSGFSRSIGFYVGEGDMEDMILPDLNVDGKVNIVDFSILLFHWGGDGGDSSPPADINHDGIVNLTDFSVMIFHWTG